MAEQNPYSLVAAVRRQWIFGLVVLATVVSVAVGALGQIREAGFFLAGVMGLGAVLRLVVDPERISGLVVRSRPLDVAFMVVLAVGLAVLAATTPNLD